MNNCPPIKKHTFVVLAYEKSPFLETCIKSLINQTIKSDILITTSTPSSYIMQISKRYHIPVIINRYKKGIAADWSFGYNSCSTDYVTLAHQDDIYYPEYTELILYSNCNRHNNLITFTNYCEIYNDNYQYTNFLLRSKRLILLPFFLFTSELSSSITRKLMLSFGNPICCPTIMYNKNLIGNFEFKREYHMNLDWEASIRLADTPGTFTYIRKILLARRIHTDSESNKLLITKKRHDEDLSILKKLWIKPAAKFISKLYSICYKLVDS